MQERKCSYPALGQGLRGGQGMMIACYKAS
jgi:hypothetical protein